MTFFAGNSFGETIFNKRYTLFPGETWELANQRQAKHVGQFETEPTRLQFYDELVNGRMAGGGRIAYSAGRDLAQMINCFVIPAEDSREGWGRVLAETIVISGTGGGVGINFSGVRGRNSTIQGTGGVSSGTVSLMKIVNAGGNEIRGGGGRRAAYMFCLEHDHPDIIEFLNAKLDGSLLPPQLLETLLQAGIEYKDIPEHLLIGNLNCANISVVFMSESPADFFRKVRADELHELKFAGNVVRTIRARELWDLIVRNALKNGEPGILNGYLANEMNNIHYARKLVSTNPCGEIWMQPYSVCCLGATVLPRFVTMGNSPETTTFDWFALRRAVWTLVRFLDDVLDTTHYPLAQVAEESRLTRRIGAGYMGVHDMLLMLGLRYSSDAGRAFVEQVAKFIRNQAYEASIQLAKEKGAFPLFDPTQYIQSAFVQQLPPHIIDGIKRHGIRNCALLTIAPYGTTSIVQGVTSGIEPMFAPAMERTYVNGSHGLHTEVVVHPLFKNFVERGWNTDHFEGANDLSAEQHIEMQMLCQQYVDNSISKTINLPQAKYTWETLSDLYMKYVPHLKGITIYPEGSRQNTPLRRIPNADGVAFIKNQNHVAVETDDMCPTGTCSI